jgi:FlaG/FlaF family flagellin (archaellin)
MKKVGRILLLSIVVLMAAVITITACGGNASTGKTPGSTLHAFIFNSNPVGFHITKGFGAARASLASPFVVNAQAAASGGGNFPGFCNAVSPSSGRAATVIYGIGRWSTGSCEDATTPDSDVGVSVLQAGQIGNLTVDAVGNGTGADSGDFEIKVIHADGTQTISAITCNLGVSAVEQKVHCEDKNAAHFTSVAATDQVSARMFYNPGDAYRAIRVNIEFAAPTF